ncbi:MAG TPA: hypothetical protein VFQ65_13260 [Kofleriaceae bacterium]|nr:hypothetical protein [Kofleriaceae bacterium]
MTLLQGAAWAAVVAGAALVVQALTWCLRRRISGPQGDHAIIKLARAGNLDRIHKLVAAAPETHLAAYAAAVRAGETATAHDMVTVAALTHPAFEQRAQLLVAAWHRVTARGAAGAVLGGAGFYVAYTAAYNPISLRALGGLSALAGVWFLVHMADLTRAISRGREEVLPELDRAFTKGTGAAAEVESDA